MEAFVSTIIIGLVSGCLLHDNTTSQWQPKILAAIGDSKYSISCYRARTRDSAPESVICWTWASLDHELNYLASITIASTFNWDCLSVFLTMRYFVLLVSWCISVSLIPAACQTGLSEADMQMILGEHNRVRRSVTPTASNMELMVRRSVTPIVSNMELMVQFACSSVYYILCYYSVANI